MSNEKLLANTTTTHLCTSLTVASHHWGGESLPFVISSLQKETYSISIFPSAYVSLQTVVVHLYVTSTALGDGLQYSLFAPFSFATSPTVCPCAHQREFRTNLDFSSSALIIWVLVGSENGTDWRNFSADLVLVTDWVFFYSPKNIEQEHGSRFVTKQEESFWKEEMMK